MPSTKRPWQTRYRMSIPRSSSFAMLTSVASPRALSVCVLIPSNAARARPASSLAQIGASGGSKSTWSSPRGFAITTKARRSCLRGGEITSHPAPLRIPRHAHVAAQGDRLGIVEIVEHLPPYPLKRRRRVRVDRQPQSHRYVLLRRSGLRPSIEVAQRLRRTVVASARSRTSPARACGRSAHPDR